MIDPDELGSMLRDRRTRASLSLRAAALETGVSYATLAKVESGHLPDLTTYRKLVAWINPGPASPTPEPPELLGEPTVDAVAVRLHRDPALTSEAAERIARVVRELYEALSQPTTLPAVHLRLATTLHPQAARKIGPLLADIKEALQKHST